MGELEVPDTIDLTPRLRLAADYLAEYGWIQHSLGAPGKSACLTGAIRFCAPQTGDEHLIRQVLIKRDRGETWNDSAGVNSADVIGFLRTAEITDADLTSTFGPQWREIVAHVRKAAGLAPAQVEALAAAPAPADDAAAYAAYAAAAAYDAAYDAAYAAYDAAYAAYAAYDATYAAYAAAAAPYARWPVRYAARGLAIRHLIGQHGYTQEHYDTMTGPWARVMGPVHPDDVVASDA